MPPAPAAPRPLAPALRAARIAGHGIRWFENIPVLSYAVAARALCGLQNAPSACATRWWSWLTGALFAVACQRWGLTPHRWGLVQLLRLLLVALACIDWDTTLLPDDLTLPLLWAGLLAPRPCSWTQRGAARCRAGARRPATCRCGGCTGPSSWPQAKRAWATATSNCLPPWALGLAGRRWCRSSSWPSVIGAVVGIAMKLSSGLREGGYIPFGPFLAGAGLVALI